MRTPWQLEVFNVSIRKKEKWRWAMPYVRQYAAPDSTCLDVGCGVGTLAALQERLGGRWQFTETDQKAAAQARRLLSGPVWEIDIFDPKLQPRHYDLMTIFDVIEHVPHPQRFLARASQLLKPTGRLLLTTPADDGGYYFWRRVADAFFGIDKAAHSHMVEGFSELELRKISQAAALSVVACDQFSFCFTEMVELLYNGAYILKNRSPQTTAGYNLALSPASEADVQRHRRQLQLLKIAYPLLRGISLLDRLQLCRRGYEWGLVAKTNY